MTDSPERNESTGGSENQEKTAARGRGSLPYYLLIMLFFILVMWGWQAISNANRTEVEYSFFLSQLEEGNVKSASLKGLQLLGQWKNVETAQNELNSIVKGLNEDLKEGEKEKKSPELTNLFVTNVPAQENENLLRRMEAKDVKYGSANEDMSILILQSMIYLLPFILLMAFLFFAMRRSSDPMGSGGMFGNFVKSQAKRFQPSDSQTTFDDVAGMEHAKTELQEVVEFLKEPSKFQRLGAEIPKGVLLMGPPGTGKTLVARAVAGEAGVPFFSINGSEFIQMFVGVGASRVRDMFRTAKENAPCILFIDEIDAVGRVRGAGVGGGHDEREQTLNQILSEMDGFESNAAVIVIAATNRPDVLDPALLRPGRFDRHVAVDRPSREGRLGILKVHVRKVKLAETVNLEEIANGTIGFSGAELKNIVNEAALHAARDGKNEVEMEDFDSARDKIMMGVPREDIMNEKERRMTAYHEAGHAILGWMLPEVDPVHKVTIVPRGRALGVTQFVPEEERFHMGETRLRQQLAMMLGGRTAEKLIFDEYSAGAEDDLKRSSQIARRMVSAWGMSEKIGPVAYRDSDEHPFLGKEMHEQRKYSEQTAFLIDQEMRTVMLEAQDLAMKTLAENRETLEKLVSALMENEVVSREHLVEILGPRKGVERGDETETNGEQQNDSSES
ncbi:ATP-dependent zinc metalloprotease FtsH [Thalassoglobus polymorphus]|uniref:ATP-dependent zinc metalloprotease FtsH n=1 Tax=Thalassoglobus polymorphus TaxID=2527994 RepID=A0A517QGT2_9PLAN|nr:ATP-dependent zinc metalloprotease FtsH [Thalassoglobus polymorphus]QDT30842.1 ATP-dependent zinc metalloprotease FtsH [Thalassoglobus polymorphus]